MDLKSVLSLNATSAGIEIRFQPEGTLFILTVLERKNGNAVIKNSLVTTDIEDLKVPKDTPVTICFTGKGILIKKTSFAPNLTQGEELAKLLPNAKLTEFFLFKTEPFQSEYFLCAARKDLLEPFINYFLKKGNFVTQAFAGPFSSESYLVVESHDQSLTQPPYQLEINKGRIISLSTKTARQETIQLENSSLYSYCSALSYFTEQTQSCSAEMITTSNESFINRTWLKRATTVALAACFAILLINFLLFDYFYKNKLTLQASLNSNQAETTLLDSLEKQFKNNQGVLNSTGLSHGMAPAYTLDKIASTVPAEMKLISLKLFPSIKGEYDEQKYFHRKLILVKGIVYSSMKLNDWIKTLKSLPWVSGVTLKEYLQHDKLSSANFHLEIKIK